MIALFIHLLRNPIFYSWYYTVIAFVICLSVFCVSNKMFHLNARQNCYLVLYNHNLAWCLIYFVWFLFPFAGQYDIPRNTCISMNIVRQMKSNFESYDKSGMNLEKRSERSMCSIRYSFKRYVWCALWLTLQLISFGTSNFQFIRSFYSYSLK